jgi:hypothetical protein
MAKRPGKDNSKEAEVISEQSTFDLGPNPSDHKFKISYQTHIFATPENANDPGITKGLKSADLIPFFIQDKRKLSYSGAVTASEATHTRLILIDGRSATLIQRAANISSKIGRNKGKDIFRHLGEREQTVLDGLKYIASRRPSAFGEYQGSACLRFTVGQVFRVLEGAYNKNEIMEALDVLHGSDTEFRLQSDDKSKGTKPVKSPLLPILITHEADVNDDLFDDGYTYMCTFHPYITKDIANLNFRQVNYARIRSRRSGMAKHIELRLSYNYTQASTASPYGPVFGSTLLLSFGLSYSPERDAFANFQPLTRAFEELVMPPSVGLLALSDDEIDKFIIEKLEVEPIYEDSYLKRKRIIDYKYTMYPTEKFIQQQVAANIVANKDAARLRIARDLIIDPDDIGNIKIDEF